LAIAGDTMFGRGVADRILRTSPAALFSGDVLDAAAEADLFLVNLECVISDRGERWRETRKPFFFRAPPVAIDVLRRLGVGCVTWPNHHSLAFGPDPLVDPPPLLRDAGIAYVGAGVDESSARAPAVIARGGARIGVVGVTDHPRAYAAQPDRPGV